MKDQPEDQPPAPTDPTEGASADSDANTEVGEPKFSDDHDWWWDGAKWQWCASVVPPNAKRSDDGQYWWDGRGWRPIPKAAKTSPNKETKPPRERKPIKISIPRRIVIRTAAVLGAILLVVIVACIRLTSITTPQTVATDYVSAIATSDAPLANRSAQVVGGTGATSSTLQQFSFGKAAPLVYTDIHADAPTAMSDSTAQVTVHFRDRKGSHQVTLNLTKSTSTHRFLFFPSWTVQVTPVSVNVAGSGDAEAVEVDGTSAGQLTADGTGTVQMLPGVHEVRTSGSKLYAPATKAISVALNPSGQLSASVNGPLAATAIADARNTVNGAMKNCASSATYGCPQSGLCQCTWTVVGEPLANFKILSGAAAHALLNNPYTSQQNDFEVFGVYGTVGTAANDSDPTHPNQLWSAGIVDVSLAWSGSGWTVNQIVPVTAIPGSALGIDVAAPSQVTDAQLTNALSAAFAACAADTSSAPSNCPQQIDEGGLGPPQVTWTLQGSPVDPNSTQVLFDTVTNSYQATGLYSYSYSAPNGGSGTTSGNWVANIIWTGKVLEVVNISQLPGGSTSNS